MRQLKALLLLVLTCSPLPLILVAEDSQKEASLSVLRLYREGHYEQAIIKCQEMDRKISRKDLSLLMDNYVIWASSLLATKKYSEAIQIALLAKDISRYDYRVIQILGEAYYFNKEELEALSYLEQYVVISNIGDQVARSYYYMGEIYIGQGYYKHANIAISTAVYHNGRNGKWWYRLGYVREMIDDVVGAKEAYNKALELNPGLAEVRKRLLELSSS